MDVFGSSGPVAMFEYLNTSCRRSAYLCNPPLVTLYSTVTIFHDKYLLAHFVSKINPYTITANGMTRFYAFSTPPVSVPLCNFIISVNLSLG